MAIRPHLDPEIPSDVARNPGPQTREKSHRGFLLLLLVIVLALAVGVILELIEHKTHEQALSATATEDMGRAPVVNIARVERAPARSVVELPCQTVAQFETPIYARADGYLKERTVDIGSRVKKGDLLVEIETPELDQQIVQGQATVAQSRAAMAQLRASLLAARASLKLAQVTAVRWRHLSDKGVVAKQDLDEKQAALESDQANVQAAEENVHAAESIMAANEANLKRLEDLKIFDRLVAPFDGVITSRNQDSDVGTLISAGNTSESRELMRVGKIDVLRVFVNVPQTYAAMIHAGVPADLVVDELPGRVFHTSVERTTHSVDSASRTMLAILLVKNPKEELLPGMYAQARFSLPHAAGVVMLPADALVLQSGGPHAAVVGQDHRVHFHTVTLGRDYGVEVEIDAGLSEGDVVVLNPNDAIRDGVIVEPRDPVKR